MGAEGAERLGHGRAGGVALITHVVVAGDDRADDARARVELGDQPSRRPDRLAMNLDRTVRRLFAAESGEELIDVVHDPQRVSHPALRSRAVYRRLFSRGATAAPGRPERLGGLGGPFEAPHHGRAATVARRPRWPLRYE